LHSSVIGEKWEYDETVHQLFIDFKKDYESVRKEVLYNILVTDIKIDSECFENVAQFIYLETSITNENMVQEKIKRLNSSNACYHSVHNICFLVCCAKTKIIIYKTVILYMVLMTHLYENLNLFLNLTSCNIH
jgi:hypothetical protein